MEDLSGTPKLFGSRTKTSVLVLIAMLEETYASELAAMLSVQPSAILKMTNALEEESLIVARQMGRTRLLSLNPRFFAANELRALLWKLGESDTELQNLAAKVRRRPRRFGKPG